MHEQNCVVIPNFGGFVAQTKAFQLKGDTFVPAHKTWLFNALVSRNDGLLAGRIAQTEGISFEQAENKLLDFVNDIKIKLSNAAVTLEGIGRLEQSNDSILFEPFVSTTTLDYFGLESLGLIPLPKEAIAPVRFEKIDRPAVKERTVRKEKRTKAKKKNLIWVPLLAVPLLFGGLMGLNSSNSVENMNFSTLNPFKQEASQYQRKSFDFNLTDEKHTHRIVVGSFSDMENAQLEAQKWTQEGLSPEVLTTENGLYRVSVFKTDDLNLAIELKQFISLKKEGSWILED